MHVPLVDATARVLFEEVVEVIFDQRRIGTRLVRDRRQQYGIGPVEVRDLRGVERRQREVPFVEQRDDVGVGGDGALRRGRIRPECRAGETQGQEAEQSPSLGFHAKVLRMGSVDGGNINQPALGRPGVAAARAGFVRQSGGLRWHLRAFFGRNRHADFKRAVAQWLEGWDPPVEGLILVGPSGGWCLPGAFLQRYAHVVSVDLDPLSPFLLRWRHGVRVHPVREDFVTALPRLLQKYPRHAVLFANLLGQLPLERTDHEHVIAALGRVLEQHHWASFHDRYSAELEPRQARAARALSTHAPMTPATLQQLGYSGVWIDHGTQDVFPASLPRQYFPWRILRHRFHWVEAGCVAPSRSARPDRSPLGIG